MAIMMVIMITSCSDGSLDDSNKSFREVIENAGELPTPQNSEEVIDVEESIEVVDDEVWKCKTTTYDALKGGGMAKEGFPLFNPNASVIYPGSLLQGKSLKKATPDIIPVDRAGGTISYNLVNGNINSAFEIKEVNKSSIQVAMNNIIANSPEELPANFTFNYEQVQSKQALSLSLGIDYESAFADVSADFDFSSEKEYNRILVKLKQNYYTMSFDIPTSLSKIFAESVTPSDLQRYVQSGNPATYISDVVYGRIFYMLIESTSSYIDMNAAIDAEFSSITNEATVDLDGSYLNTLDEVKIKVMAFGGESGSTIKTISGNLNQLVDLLAESGTISTGLPLSYVVRSVNTGQIVGVQLATQYDVTECTPSDNTNDPIFTAHWRGKVLSKMGPVGAAFSENRGTHFILISQDGKQFMRSYDLELEGPFPIDDLFEGEFSFGDEGIGAATHGEEEFFFISKSGLFATRVFKEGENALQWGEKVTVESLRRQENGAPFKVNGIGAMLFDYILHGEGIVWYNWAFNKDGNTFASFQPGRSYGTSHKPSKDISKWGNGTLPLDKVGAGIGFNVDWSKQYIIFNHSGTQYYISNEQNNFGGDGPFDL